MRINLAIDPDSFTIGRIEYGTFTTIKTLDPVSWGMALDEWIDAEVSDGNLITFDNGSNYFWTYDIERFIAEQSQKDEAPPV